MSIDRSHSIKKGWSTTEPITSNGEEIFNYTAKDNNFSYYGQDTGNK